MKVKNLTNEMRPLKVVDLSDNRELTIYIEGKSCCDLSSIYVADINQLGGSLVLVSDSGDIINTAISINPVLEEYENSEDSDEDNNSTDDSVGEEESTDEDADDPEEGATSLDNKFICDVCGAEFASARGLNSHKTRSHLNEDDK